MGTPLRVAVFGASGRVGQTVVDAVKGAPDMELVSGVDQVDQSTDFPWFTDAATAVRETRPDVAIDFTVADAVAENAPMAIAAGVSPVIGTTGMSPGPDRGDSRSRRERRCGAPLSRPTSPLAPS